MYPITKQLIFDGRKNKVLNNKINLKIPIILFHGKKDNVVPVNYSRKILKFCELDWDPSCLNFHKNKKTPIKTASIVQARKPIYSSSVKLNQKYEKYFEELFNSLNE